MIDIGIDTKNELPRLLALLRSHHTIRIAVMVMDLDGNYSQDYSSQLLDGQVTVDATADVTRSLDLTLFDPFGKIHMDPDDPSHLSVYIADQVKVVYVVIDPITTAVYNIPVFCGPVDSVSRDDTTIKISAVGKESLATNNSYVGRTFKKGAVKTDVIKHILRDIMGETKYQVPNKGGKLAHDLKITRDSIPWKVAKQLASSLGYQLFYDGRGVCRMRQVPSAAQHTFNDLWIVGGKPEVSYDLTAVVNTVVVTGKTPQKAKKPVTATAIAPKNHPLSPWRLGRNGVPRYILQTVSDSSYGTAKECRQVAQKVLAAGLRAGVNAKWDGLPMPLLEENDPVHVNSGDVNVLVQLDQFTIPLTIASASYGYVKKIRPLGGKPAIRHRRTRKAGKK